MNCSAHPFNHIENCWVTDLKNNSIVHCWEFLQLSPEFPLLWQWAQQYPTFTRTLLISDLCWKSFQPYCYDNGQNNIVSLQHCCLNCSLAVWFGLFKITAEILMGKPVLYRFKSFSISCFFYKNQMHFIKKQDTKP